MNNLRLKDFIKVDDRFQNSINLFLDYNKPEKVLSYIPTKSSIDILNRYLNNVLEDTKEKSTILIGPYGKGKSHLLLVLLFLLSKGMDKEYKEITNELINKIERVNKGVAIKVKQLSETGEPFLPVIISNTQQDLNTAFLIALNEALIREGLEDICPHTYYTEAISVIDNWKNKYITTYEQFNELLIEKGMDTHKLYLKLKSCDKEAMDLFKAIYPELTAGSTFRPMINTELLPLYKSVNEILCEKYGYSGIYIIFDEFSKYIEGNSDSSIANEMKIIQDLCELANESKTKQLHICFVAHKSIKEYINVLPKAVINAFTGVEGRLEEVLFVTSSQNNYELIQNAIRKDDKIIAQSEDLQLMFTDMYKHTHYMPAFETLFNTGDYKSIVVQGCFPLSPIAAYLLLAVSEKVAQNERTLFTFISKDEPFSMARFIKKQEVGEEAYIGADYIYDYFKPIFRKEIANPLIHSEWLKAEYALSQSNEPVEIKLIKALAIFNIVNKMDEMPVVKEYLGIAVCLNNGIVDSALSNLSKKQLIDKRNKTDLYYFKNNVGVDIDKEIRRIITVGYKLNYIKMLNEITELNYVTPKLHNQNYSMTRFFDYEFFLYEDFINILDSSVWFREKFADGKILCLVSNTAIDVEKCKRHLKELNDNRLIIIIPNEVIDVTDKLKKLYAVQQLKADSAFIADNKVLQEELNLYEEDIIYDINAIIERGYLPEEARVCNIMEDDITIKNTKEFNRFLSMLCDRHYFSTPIINNEMVNKNVISTQIKLARTSLVRKIIKLESLQALYTATSPEASIFRAALLNTGVLVKNIEINDGIQAVIHTIKTFIDDSEDNKQCFIAIYDKLLMAPFGMRKGVIPIYIAYALSNLRDTPVLYLGDKEVVITEDIINNIGNKPEQYYLYVERGTKEKDEYLCNLDKLFDRYKNSNDEKYVSMNGIITKMQRWMQGLSMVATNYIIKQDEIPNKEEYVAMLKLREILKKAECNPREVLFETIPSFFESKSYIEYFQHIANIKKSSDDYLDMLKVKVVKETKAIFSKSDTDDLFMILHEWYTKQSDKAKRALVSSKISSFMNYIQNMDTHNSTEIVNKLAKILLDIYIENWNNESFDNFISEINAIKQDIELTVDSSVNQAKNQIRFTNSKGKIEEKYYEADKEDSTSYFLKNALNDALDEFGDTLEVNQKVSVLVQLIEKIING